MSIQEDGKGGSREPGKNPFPVSRVQRILKADTQLPTISKEAVFLISVATEKFIERLAQAGQRVAERQSRVSVQERDICAVVRGIEEFTFLWDVLSEPDDSYPVHEQKATGKPKNPNTPGPLGKFFNKPSVSAAGLEDIAMNEGETAVAGEESSA